MSKDYQLNLVQKDFLENNYLAEKFQVPYVVEQTTKYISKNLTQRYGDSFVGLCIVGGLVNGSYILRSNEKEVKPKSLFSRYLKKGKVVSDVNFYLIIDNPRYTDLEGMADYTLKRFKDFDFPTGATLNGRNPDDALDISKLNQYIENEKYDLLSLPFKYAIGERINEVQKQIVKAVQKNSKSQEIWDEIRFYHDSPLALYHVTFEPEFMDYVSEAWVPKKIEKFGLLELEDMLPLIEERAKSIARFNRFSEARKGLPFPHIPFD